MKHTHILIALAMLAAITMVSCGNNKKAQSQEPTQEEVQEMKQALADSVLAEIDALAEEYINASSKSFGLRVMELTEAEKLIKPDYLLDPAEANNLVTKSQKINALAIYVMELSVREIYDMPLEETKEAIAKLAIDVNHPVDIDKYDGETPASEIIKVEYEKCKQNGELAYFWQFENAISFEIVYLFAQNPELFFKNISDKQWNNFNIKQSAKRSAIEELAKYDEEMATLLEFRNKNRVSKSDEEWKEKETSIVSAKQFFIANKDKYTARRNALLQ